jgi:hypothetical protein
MKNKFRISARFKIALPKKEDPTVLFGELTGPKINSRLL